MNLEKFIKYSVPVFVIAVVSRSIEEISFVYYAVPVMCVLFIAYYLRNGKSLRRDPFGKKSKVNWEKDIVDPSTSLRMTDPEKSDIKNPESSIQNLKAIYLFILPGIWFLLTSLWSSYPSISALRSLYFILLSGGCISAGILWIRYSGKSVFDFLLPANIFIVTLSLFSLITNIPSDSWTGGNGKGFMSLFGHQNLLASVLLFTLPAIFDVKIKDQSKPPKASLAKSGKLKVFFVLLLSLNLLLLALTYSRASILSLLFGVLIYLLLNKKWKVIFYTLSASALLAVIIYITPSLNNLSENIINKEYPEFYTSRMWMWEPSYRAAVDGGLIGIGYGISDPNEKVGGMGDHFEGDRFVREKGNSTFALIEETGLIGLILFLIPIFVIVILRGTKDLTKRRFFSRQVGIRMTTENSLLTAALAAFILHAQFEAWWVGVGSVQLPLFFIYIGLIVQGWVVQGTRFISSRFNSSRFGSSMFGSSRLNSFTVRSSKINS